MAVNKVRALINAAEFPFSYEHAGRSVNISQDLTGRMPAAFFGNRASVEYGVPQLLFCENVLPFARGLFSVGYSTQTAPADPATVDFDQAIVLRDTSENQTLFVPANGQNFVYDADTGTWVSTNPFTFAGGLVTRAYVNGRSFVGYEKDRVIEYDNTTNSFVTRVLTLPVGYTMADVRGIGGASNYLLLFTEVEVLWSSPINMFDFASTDNGAGGQIPIDIKGRITALLPVAGGFIVYSGRNAVGATFTNNAAAPFIFREIANSGGVASYEQVTSEANDAGHFAWSSSGLQKLTLAGAETILPAVTDFLVGKVFDQWNAATKEVEVSDSGVPFYVKLSYAAGRYLIVSYGQSDGVYTACLVYDLPLERWGKLSITHTDCFTYPYPGVLGDLMYEQLDPSYQDLGDASYADLGVGIINITPPKRGIAFLLDTGETKIITTDLAQITAAGVAIFGHFQRTLGHQVTCQCVEIEGIKNSPIPEVSLLLSDTGYRRENVVTPTLVKDIDGYQRWDSRCTAENFDLAIEGNFVLTGALLWLTQHGSR